MSELLQLAAIVAPLAVVGLAAFVCAWYAMEQRRRERDRWECAVDESADRAWQRDRDGREA